MDTQNEVTFLKETSKNGQPTLLIQSGAQQVYLHSKYDPQKEAETFCRNSPIDDTGHIILFGLGFGYQARALLNRLSPSCKLFILEPESPIYSYGKELPELTAFLGDERVFLQVIGNEQDIHDFFYVISQNIASLNYTFLALPVYTQLFYWMLPLIDNGFKSLDDFRQVSADSFRLHMKDWQKHFWKNIPNMMESYNGTSLFGKWAGKLVVMVGAGPSLSKNVHLLKELGGNCIIVCLYTAWRVLDQWGIVPDLVVSIDAKQPLYSPQTVTAKKPALLYFTISNPHLVTHFDGTKLLCFTLLDKHFSPLLNISVAPEELIEGDGSVACIALDFIVKTGANPIILLGMDLAFTDGHTHAKETVYGSNNFDMENENNEILFIEDINGKKIKTSASLQRYLTWFNQYIPKLTGETGIEVIDATEGGAKIKGTTIATLRDSMDRLSPSFKQADLNLFEVANKLFAQQDSESVIHQLSLIETQLKNLIPILHKGVGESHKLMQIYGKNKNTGQKKITQILNKFKYINNELALAQDKMEAVAILLHPVIEEMNQQNVEHPGDGLTVAKQSLLFYEGILNGIETTLPFIQETLETIKAKQERP